MALGSVGGRALLLYALGLLWFRIGEIIPLVSLYGRECACSVALVFGPVGRRVLGRRARGPLFAVSLAALVYVLDHHAPRPPPPSAPRHAGATVVVTGANSGVGRETARRLATEYGMRVVMGCRSEARCRAAAANIAAEIAATDSGGSVTPLLVDLGSLDSVAAFAARLVDVGKVDILFNNAGFLPVPGTPVNGLGLEYSFAAMHLGPFLLTERLLAANPRLRVVNTSSGTHHTCAMPWWLPPAVLKCFPVSYRPGCVDGEYLRQGVRAATGDTGYIHAKTANVMHAVELPRRHPGAVAVAIDLGWVETSIQPWMGRTVTLTSLGWMRSVRLGVAPVLSAILASEEELRVDLGERGKWGDTGFVMNTMGVAEEAFSYCWWKRGVAVDLSRGQMILRSQMLWEESKKLLETHGY